MRRSYSAALVLFFASVGLTQCASNQREPMEAGRQNGASDFMVPASRVEQPRPEAGRTGEPTTALTDGKIAMVSDVAHNAATEAARIAFVKTENQRVKEFAQMMLADHGKAKRDETSLLLELRVAPEASDLSTNLGIESSQTLLAMRETTKGTVDQTYIDSQLASHEKLLGILDEQLIPNASNSRLKTLLQNFRERVKVHVDRAREIQQELSAESEQDGAMPGGPSGPAVP